MARTRVEDLGKIAILIDEVLKNKFFEEEIFVIYAETERNQFIKVLTDGIDENRKKLYLIKQIADGHNSD